MNTHLTEDILIKYQFDLLDEAEKKIVVDHLADCSQCRTLLGELSERFSLLDVLADEMEVSDELLHRTVATSDVSKSQKTSVYRLRWIGFAASAAAVLVAGVFFWGNGQDSTVVTDRVVDDETELFGVALQEGIDKPQIVADAKDNLFFSREDSDLYAWKENLSSDRTKINDYGSVGGLGLKSSHEFDQNWAMKLGSDPYSSFWSKNAPLDSAVIELKSETSDSFASAAVMGIAARSSSAAAHGVRIISEDQMPDKPPFAPASAIELVVLPRPQEMQVTIYNSADLTLVRDKRKLTLKPGYNWLQFMWAGTKIDPTSLSLRPLEYDDKIDIEQLVYPAGLKEIGRWLIRSQVEGAVEFEITYFASGLNWRAFYMGTMNQDETKMALKGYVRVANNSGQDFNNARTRLIVGQTRLIEPITTLANRYYPYGPEVKLGTSWDFDGDSFNVSGKVPFLGDRANHLFYNREGQNILLGGEMGGMGGGRFDAYFHYDVKSVAKEGLSEYFLYTIEGTENLTNGWAKRLPSMDVEGIPVKSLYKYDDDRYGKTPVRFVSFANDDEHELGETPLPDGEMKIYRYTNADLNLSYVGGADVKYIPVNEDVELNLGPARLVKVEPVLMAKSTENITFDDKGNIDGWDEIEEYKVTVTNTREIPIDMEMTWNMGTVSWELDMDDKAGEVEYKKHDSKRARFTMTVQPRSEVIFTNKIRKYREKRQEAYVAKQKEMQK